MGKGGAGLRAAVPGGRPGKTRRRGRVWRENDLNVTVCWGHVGVDGKCFRAGQSCISLLTDLEGRWVLDAVEERTQAAAEAVGHVDPRWHWTCGSPS